MRSDGYERWLRLARLALLLLAGMVVVLAVVSAASGFTQRVEDSSDFVIRAAVVVAVLLGGALICGGLARRVRRATVLSVDLTTPLTDGVRSPLDAVTGRGGLSLLQTVETLERATADPRVAGLLVWVRSPAKGLATASEIRDALLAFRASGKFAYAFAETFGEGGDSHGSYYVATACDEIWLQPTGDVGLIGVGMEVEFLRGTLDKLGVEAQIDHRHEYKAAKNRLTETEFTPPHRESSQAVVASLFERVVAAVAERRGLSEATVRELIDRGPVLGSDAVAAGLVDRLAYRDELTARFEGRLLPAASYHRRAVRRRRRGRGIALIHAEGPIVLGRSRSSLLGRAVMGSDTVTAAFRRAIEDKRVKAVLFRVDSPGGSAVGSDTIRRAVVRARAAGKPVVVSMGDLAGSGGYYVALDADRIVAQPATITGSIGVVGGKLVLSGLKAKLGISHDEVHAGAHALIGSANRGYSDSEWKHVQRWLDRTYDEFVAKVAAGRDLTVERVRDAAKGRIWSGAQARELGLVDELGGYRIALAALRELLGLTPGAPLSLIDCSRPRSPLARLLGRDGHEQTGGLLDTWGAEATAAVEALAALRALAEPLGDRPGDALLRMPALRLRGW